MTKLHTNITWRGALYNMIRGAGRSVKQASAWLRDERDVTLSEKTLYKKLDGSNPAETVNIDLAELLTEYALAHGASREEALRWIQALAARHDAVVLDLRQEEDAPSCEVAAITDKTMHIGEINGELISIVRNALIDMDVCQNDAHRIGDQIMVLVYALLRMKRKVDCAAGMR